MKKVSASTEKAGGVVGASKEVMNSCSEVELSCRMTVKESLPSNGSLTGVVLNEDERSKTVGLKQCEMPEHGFGGS